MKRQGLIVTIQELNELIYELSSDIKEDKDWDRKFQINIINKTPECSDTWEIEKWTKKKN